MCTKETKALVIDKFQLQEPKTISSCLFVCFAMVQIMLSLWSLFIEFLGSYSRCRVTNGVMPRVLGPTSFYLKSGWTFWPSECCCVPRTNIRMLLCSSSECWCSWCSSSGFINDERLDEFLDLFQAWHEICWALSTKR